MGHARADRTAQSVFLSLPASAHFMTEEEESQSTETTLAEIGEIGVGTGDGGRRRHNQSEICGRHHHLLG